MAERFDLPVASAVPVTEEPPNRDPHERRGEDRYPFTAAAEVYDARTKSTVTGRCSDLALGGCYIDTFSPFAVGAVVAVRMARDNREFQAAAVVANAHLQMGMGLAFTEIKREHQTVLRSWIADLSGEPMLEPEAAPQAPETPAKGDDSNLRFVINELITLLVRRKMITESEGAELLRHTFR